MFYSLPTEIKLGMALGRIGFLEEIIRRTGWGIKPESFAPGTHQNEPPTAYPGLNESESEQATERDAFDKSGHYASKWPIAFIAIKYGNMEAIDWVFGDGPANAMEEFMMKHPEDERNLLLQNSHWKNDVGKWLGTEFKREGDNAFHAALFSRDADTIEKVYRIFTERGISPLDLLDSTQTKLNHNSLMISARMGANFQNIYDKYVLASGDPTFVDQHGYNILHILAQTKDIHNLKFCISLLTTDQKTKMLEARTLTTLYTPVAIAVLSKHTDAVQCLLEGGTTQLNIRDADGNLPIHLAVGRGYAKIARILAESDLKLLLVEDAAGSVPMRIAKDSYLLDRTRTNPFFNIPESLRKDLHTTTWFANVCESRPADFFAARPTLPDSFDKPDFVGTMQVVQDGLARIDPGLKWERTFVKLEEMSGVIRRATEVANSKDPEKKDSAGRHSPDSPSLGPPWTPLSSEQDGF
jgi:hypothetical protein